MKGIKNSTKKIVTIKKEKKCNDVYRVYFNTNAIKLFPTHEFYFEQDKMNGIVSLRETIISDTPKSIRVINKQLSVSTLNLPFEIEDGHYELIQDEDDYFTLTKFETNATI